MRRGRKITLHLVEGTASGIIKGQIGNWVGQVTVGKITQLIEFASDDDVKRPGIYLLSGPDPQELNDESVYIGESENVWERLKQHNDDEAKAHFEKVAVISSRDESLTKGHVLYLESRLIDITKAAGRANVLNTQHPRLSALPLADRDELEVFLEHLNLLLPVLGLNFILPSPVDARNHRTMIKENPSVDSPMFELNTTHRESKISVKAQAQVIDGEFVVFENSTALQRSEGNYSARKEQLIRNGGLILKDGRYYFKRNIPFDSPSAAAAVVRGQNTNGREFWKLPSGSTYNQWLEERIEQEESQA